MGKSYNHRAERVRVWVCITHTLIPMYPYKSLTCGSPNNNYLMYLLIFSILRTLSWVCELKVCDYMLLFYDYVMLLFISMCWGFKCIDGLSYMIIWCCLRLFSTKCVILQMRVFLPAGNPLPCRVKGMGKSCTRSRVWVRVTGKTEGDR